MEGKTDLLQVDRAELFKQIFKKAPPTRLREFSVRLFLDDKEIDQVKILWDQHFKDFRFQSVTMANRLDSILAPDWRSLAHGPNGAFASNQLKSNKFGVILDEAEYILKISIVPEQKLLQLHEYITRPSEMRFGEEVKPAWISAYLNSNWTQNWFYNERFFSGESARILWERYNGRAEPVREPLQADLEAAVRTMGLVFHSTGRFLEMETGELGSKNFLRQESRVVMDLPTWNARLSLLDVSQASGYSAYSVPQIGGVHYNAGNALISSVSTEGKDVGFFLNGPAEVQVVLNDALVKTLRLGSGAHSVAGITGHPGRNTGEVRIYYTNGATQVIPFEFTQAFPRVLPPGERRFSLSAGTQRLGENRYGTTTRDFVTTSSYSQGLGGNWNGDVCLGVQQNLQVASANVLWIQDSTTAWEAAATGSLDSVGRIGHKLTLRMLEKIDPVLISTTASFTQAYFQNALFTSTHRQPVSYQFGLEVGRPLWRGNLNLNANVQFKREDDSLSTPLDYSIGLNYSIDAWKGLSINALGNCVIQSGEFSPYASLILSYFFNTGRHSMYAMNQVYNQKRYNSPMFTRRTVQDTMYIGTERVIHSSDTTLMEGGSYRNEWSTMANTGWSWSEGMGMVGGKSLSVSANYNQAQYGLRLSGQKTTNFGELSASYSLSDQSQSGLMSRNNYLSTRLSTALMFADGTFGVGRPVTDGFVLVKGRHDLATTSFRVNPSEQFNSEYSEGGRILAANYGLISPYRTENFRVKTIDAPLGTFLDGDQYFVRNTYKQGFVLKLGKPPRVFVRFRLLDESGQALGYTTFRVLQSSDTSVQVHQSFSSKEGIVQISNLLPGHKYLIRFGEDAFVKDLVISIPKDAATMLNLGDLRIEHESLSRLAKLAKNLPDPTKKTQDVATSSEPAQPSETGSEPSPAPSIQEKSESN